MAKKLLVLAPETGGIVQRITTASFHGTAEQMYQLERNPIILDRSLLQRTC